MSLNQLANHMSAQGRGPDSTLVHMSPREVSGLQSLAMAHGGTLTINPQTGLPEAGFLDSLLPTLLGGAATYFTGGAITPMMAAMGVGGLTALTSKDLGKGLMAGLGAYGGAGITEGLAGFGANAIGAEAATAALPSGASSVSGDYDLLQAQASNAAQTGASYSDKLSRGVTEGFKNPMNALSAIGGGSKFKGAALLGAPLLSALSTQEATPAPTFQQIQFDPRAANINMRRSQLAYQPDTGSSAQRKYFTPMTIDQYGADGGFVADGGIQHFASGGVPLDPTYDYSGYGRKKSTPIVPVVQPRDVPKPDFVGADGKTYRYDPMKKSWYVIKDAAAKVNPGVEVLMGGEGGGDYGGKGTGTYGGNSTNAFTNSPLGTVVGNISNALSTPKTQKEIDDTPVVDKTGTPVNFNTDPNTGVPDINTNTGTTGMNTGTTGGSPAQAGDIGNPGGPGVNSAQAQAQAQAAAAEKDTRDARADAIAAEAANASGIAALGVTTSQAQQAAAEQDTQEARADAARSASSPISVEQAKALGYTDAQIAAMQDKALARDYDVRESNRAPAPALAEDDNAGTPISRSDITAASLSGIAALGTGPNTGVPDTDTNTGTTSGMSTGTTGGSPQSAGDIGNPGGPGVSGIAALDAGPNTGVSDTDTNTGTTSGMSTGTTGGSPEQAGDIGNPGGPSGGPEGPGGGGAGPEGNGEGNGNGNGEGNGEGNGGGDGGGDGGWAYGGTVGQYSQGGLGSLGGYSDGGRLLRGPGDGVSDHIPATIGRTRQPARLADGEFVVPARIVSELGNGSTEAGARALYKMMDRIQANRRKTTGKNSVAVDSKAHKYLPA